jgi:hypothetical protein
MPLGFEPDPDSPWDKATRLERQNQKLREALEDVLMRIERSDHWWIDVPDRGGFDLEQIKAALAYQ